MCGWTNQEEGDDFDWKLARGSDNFFTGPARDFYSFSREYPLGGFIHIDAGFPRRPGDRALLLSPAFEPTGTCVSPESGLQFARSAGIRAHASLSRRISQTAAAAAIVRQSVHASQGSRCQSIARWSCVFRRNWSGR